MEKEMFDKAMEVMSEFSTHLREFNRIKRDEEEQKERAMLNLKIENREKECQEEEADYKEYLDRQQTKKLMKINTHRQLRIRELAMDFAVKSMVNYYMDLSPDQVIEYVTNENQKYGKGLLDLCMDLDQKFDVLLPLTSAESLSKNDLGTDGRKSRTSYAVRRNPIAAATGRLESKESNLSSPFTSDNE